MNISHLIDVSQSCFHIANQQESSFYRRFTGRGRECRLICPDCAKLPWDEVQWVAVGEEVLRQVENSFGACEGVQGRPEIAVLPSDLSFASRRLQVAAFARSGPLAIEPWARQGAHIWLALRADGVLFRIDDRDGQAEPLLTVTSDELDLAQEVEIHASPDGRLVALCNTSDRKGVVIELAGARRTMNLLRDDYYPEHSPFPLAFFLHRGELRLVYATEWNRLDVFDPYSGELLTRREFEPQEEAGKRPPHYLDYFHGHLSVSPDGRWAVVDGWVWHPVGCVQAWRLDHWLERNVWESEDGDSLRGLADAEYFWGRPVCWIDDTTVAVWGLGEGDDWIMPGVALFDFDGEDRGFFGPEVAPAKRCDGLTEPSHRGLYFDKYLFACSGGAGISVWDVERQGRLLIDPTLSPVNYHPVSREFLSVLPEGVWILSSLTD